MPAKQFLSQLGVLRVTLLVLALLTVVLRPTPGAEAVYEGWSFARTVLLPALAPLLFMGVMFDALMARVMMVDKVEAQRQRYRRIAWVSFGTGVLLLLFWIPYFIGLWRT
jgi:hypothetical protein